MLLSTQEHKINGHQKIVRAIWEGGRETKTIRLLVASCQAFLNLRIETDVSVSTKFVFPSKPSKTYLGC